ncbi:MAG: hypothetical protein ACRCT1_20340 [Microcoleaceae cyanobacterium]
MISERDLPIPNYQSPITNSPSPITNYQLPIPQSPITDKMKRLLQYLTMCPD